LAALLHGTLVVGVSQTAAFNRGRHLYSAGRPSGGALAHISSSSTTCPQQFLIFSLKRAKDKAGHGSAQCTAAYTPQAVRAWLHAQAD